MGGGSYSSTARSVRATSSGYYSKSSEEIFSQSMSGAMSPLGIKLRESRDSAEHPTSLAIAIALDLTGSMGTVPHELVKDGLPTIVSKIQQRGIEHPQLLFMGVGDHEYDRAPFQVGQFESSDELMDKWLTSLWIERGGGGNTGESYSLAWYFAGYRTAIDCWEKRKQKGFLFTVGDEPTLRSYPKRALERIFGQGQYQDFTDAELLAQASKTYNVYHVHVRGGTSRGTHQEVMDGWKQLLGDNLIIAERREDIPDLIADKIVKVAGLSVQSTAKPEKAEAEEPTRIHNVKEKEETVLL